MSLRRKAARGAFWTLLQSGGQRLIGLAVFLVIARILSPEEFGLMALATIAVAFVELFINIGFGDAIVQRKDIDDIHLDSAFWTIMGIGVSAALLLAVGASSVADLFSQPQLAPMLKWLSLAIILTALSRVQAALLRRRMQFHSLAIRTLAGAIFGGLVGVTAAVMDYGVWALVAQQLSGAAVCVLVLWWAADWRPRLRFSITHIRSLFRFGANVLGANIMHFINQQADRALVGFFLGTIAVGLYTVAQRLVHILTEVLARTLANVMYPAFSRLQDDEAALGRTYLASSQLAGLLTLPIFLGIAAGGDEIVIFILGEQWQSAAPLLRILAIAGAVQSILVFNDPVFKAKGRPDLSFKLGIVRALLGVCLFSIAVHWGVEAVAYAWLLRTLIIAPLSMHWIRNLIGVRMAPFLKKQSAPLAGALVVTAIVMILFVMSRGSWSPARLVATELMVALPAYILVVKLLDRDLFRKAVDLGRQALPRPGSSKRRG